ncbi:hypothetical protein E9934_07150 [Nocardioides caeni]|uniref:Secreted protein n=1 Tax=Nocardioides caeni TaxID=574700 RepID=A0A4S8NIZ5_9ACTN|nr:hypothetical protein [Nocardioides caeni]THV16101.1 hypothetical protein E9934_07150 [Nocardioides caeni]
MLTKVATALGAVVLLPLLSACGGGSSDSLDDDSTDWSQLCGTLRVIAADDDESSERRAKALDRISENC